jgi:glutamine amidotransferase
MKEVGLVDYGMGNLRSVRNALELLGARVLLLEDPAGLSKVDRVVLPGVGAFAVAMTNLRNVGWDDALSEYVLHMRRPFLGLCLGLQLLADRGTEHGEHRGLGFIAGATLRLERPDDVPLPHIGWNEVRPVRTDGILSGVKSGTCFYFVHSYALVPEDLSVVAGVTEYGGHDFVSVIERDNIVATQFHPEKSQTHGLDLLRRFLAM